MSAALRYSGAGKDSGEDMYATGIRPECRGAAAAPGRLVSRRLALLLFVLLISVASDALAYLDPGTGSILLQGLIAGIAAAFTFASIFWQRIKLFFRSLTRRSDRDKPSDNEPPR